MSGLWRKEYGEFMIIFIVLYFAIAFVLSIIGTYLQYRIDFSHEDIYRYFSCDFSVMSCIAIWIVWPLVLVMAFFVVVLPDLYMSAVILLDKFFGGKKND